MLKWTICMLWASQFQFNLVVWTFHIIKCVFFLVQAWKIHFVMKFARVEKFIISKSHIYHNTTVGAWHSSEECNGLWSAVTRHSFNFICISPMANSNEIHFNNTLYQIPWWVSITRSFCCGRNKEQKMMRYGISNEN